MSTLNYQDFTKCSIFCLYRCRSGCGDCIFGISDVWRGVGSGVGGSGPFLSVKA